MNTLTLPKEAKKVRGLTTGSFDILSLGHIKYLEYCKENCDELIVLLDTDERITSLKGLSRPIVPLAERAQIIQALRYVTWVSSFDSDDMLIGQLQHLNPDIVFCGGDWEDKKDKIIGYSIIKDKLKFFPRILEYSTTNIERKIIENHFRK